MDSHSNRRVHFLSSCDSGFRAKVARNFVSFVRLAIRGRIAARDVPVCVIRDLVATLCDRVHLPSLHFGLCCELYDGFFESVHTAETLGCAGQSVE